MGNIPLGFDEEHKLYIVGIWPTYNQGLPKVEVYGLYAKPTKEQQRQLIEDWFRQEANVHRPWIEYYQDHYNQYVEDISPLFARDALENTDWWASWNLTPTSNAVAQWEKTTLLDSALEYIKTPIVNERLWEELHNILNPELELLGWATSQRILPLVEEPHIKLETLVTTYAANTNLPKLRELHTSINNDMGDLLERRQPRAQRAHNILLIFSYGDSLAVSFVYRVHAYGL